MRKRFERVDARHERERALRRIADVVARVEQRANIVGSEERGQACIRSEQRFERILAAGRDRIVRVHCRVANRFMQVLTISPGAYRFHQHGLRARERSVRREVLRDAPFVDAQAADDLARERENFIGAQKRLRQNRTTVRRVVERAFEIIRRRVLPRNVTEAAIALLNELNSNVEKGVFIVVAVLLAPMIEELTFRIFLFNALERFVPAGGAIAISGILFGLVHSASLSQILTVALPLAAAGIVLGTIYARTRNYWACVVTHATFNATSVIALVVFHVKG